MNDNPFCFGSTVNFLLVICIQHAQDRWIQNDYQCCSLKKGGVFVFPVLLLVVLPPHLVISERGTYICGWKCVRAG